MAQHFVVLRFQSMYPEALGKMQMHFNRTGGPLDNIELAHSGRNRLLIGPREFAAPVREEIAQMARDNRDQEEAALIQAGKPRAAARVADAPVNNPWNKGCRNGPLREAILTTDWRYFEAQDDAPDNDILITHGRDPETRKSVERRLSKAKIDAFAARGKAFFEVKFPGQVRHLRLDLDEETPHFHALILPRAVKVSKRRGSQSLIQPSDNDLLKNYELAQDVVGEFFAPIGLVRGKKKAAARRTAKKRLEVPEERREHISPREWRDGLVDTIVKRLDACAASEFLTERVEAVADEKLARAETAIESAMQSKSSAEAYENAVTRGVQAVEDEEMIYRAPSEEVSEGLSWGRNAPDTKEARKTLQERIKPAAAFLVSFARSFAAFRRRERDLESRESILAKKLASFRAAVGQAFGQMPERFGAFFEEVEQPEHREEDFPGALVVRQDRKLEDLERDLVRMPNQEIVGRFWISREAALLVEGNPALRADFVRGRECLRVAAGARGVDLETGRHDPATASDRTKAVLHRDQPKEPPTRLRVRTPAPRQRVR